MKYARPFALSADEHDGLRRKSLQNILILCILALIIVLTALDIYSDLKDGVALLHLTGEFLIAGLSSATFFMLWKRVLKLGHHLADQVQLTNEALAVKTEAQSEALIWKKEAAHLMRGLSDIIDEQLSRWKLTAAEKEVTLLLLKGLSLKEIANVRGVSEKTARAQSFTVYAKSGLNGRAELAAYFLEDLMLPNENSHAHLQI